jgi:hypothetical protein
MPNRAAEKEGKFHLLTHDSSAPATDLLFTVMLATHARRPISRAKLSTNQLGFQLNKHIVPSIAIKNSLMVLFSHF